MIIALALATLLFEGVRIRKLIQNPSRPKGAVSAFLFTLDWVVFAIIAFQLINPDVGRLPVEGAIGTMAQIVGLALVIGGSIFASWARIHMGTAWRTGWDASVPARLTTDGPWRLCRHPIYAGTWLFAVGFEMALVNGLLFGAIASIAVLSHIAKKEEDVLETHFGTSWKKYAHGKNLFLPS